MIIGSQNARATIEECLEALAVHDPQDGVEIVVVDNSTDGTADTIRQRYANVRLITMPSSLLMPELWEAGIRQSAGEVVALTTGNCIPDRDWIRGVLKAHETPVPAIGGAIENDESAGVVDWAIYFCRYSRYMLPLKEGQVTEIAGDNASYKRRYIDECRQARRYGFWESAVHAELRHSGLRLLLVPSIVVRHKRTFSFRSFMRQRLWHGMQFGQERSRQLTALGRALHVVGCPAIPLLLLARITRRVVAKRRHGTKLLASIPVLTLFLLAWTAGELIGYVRGQTA